MNRPGSSNVIEIRWTYPGGVPNVFAEAIVGSGRATEAAGSRVPGVRDAGGRTQGMVLDPAGAARDEAPVRRNLCPELIDPRLLSSRSERASPRKGCSSTARVSSRSWPGPFRPFRIVGVMRQPRGCHPLDTLHDKVESPFAPLDSAAPAASPVVAVWKPQEADAQDRRLYPYFPAGLYRRRRTHCWWSQGHRQAKPRRADAARPRHPVSRDGAVSRVPAGAVAADAADRALRQTGRGHRARADRQRQHGRVGREVSGTLRGLCGSAPDERAGGCADGSRSAR